MKLFSQELGHIVFLSEVIHSGNKRHLMGDAMKCLLYVAKSLEEVEVSEEVKEELDRLIAGLESQLIKENDRIREIRGNLSEPAYLRKFGDN
ncbi:hypothetical protein [Ferviditalea candida]|uniref:Uncharacterized protein n=1 Tax=Ferviditalea candida TaxID=3108399 RepID=A0ABU5ZCJ9_9BACL|nr:hypothetical protein [Paenibacillaceae bacterium T2]